MSNYIIVTSDCQTGISECLRDKKCLFAEWNYEREIEMMFDTGDQLHQCLWNYLETEKMRHIETVRKNYTLDAKQRTVFLICLFDESLADHSPVNRLAFAFHYQTSCHVIVLKEECVVCRGTPARLCSSCYRACYCSKDCQRADAPKHKENCRLTKPEKGYRTSDIAHNFDEINHDKINKTDV